MFGKWIWGISLNETLFSILIYSCNQNITDNEEATVNECRVANGMKIKSSFSVNISGGNRQWSTLTHSRGVIFGYQSLNDLLRMGFRDTTWMPCNKIHGFD